MLLNNNTFQANQAIEGGVIYAESDSMLSSLNDNFFENKAD